MIFSRRFKETKKNIWLISYGWKTPKSQTTDTFINKIHLKLAQTFWANQFKTDGSFHFDTSNTIFSLGFGPKYYINETTHLSIGPFAQKKKIINQWSYIQRRTTQRKIYIFRQLYWIYSLVFECLRKSFSKGCNIEVEDGAFVIPIDIGTIVVYSGFLLTHRQLIRRKNENIRPIVNIVSYNSQKII